MHELSVHELSVHELSVHELSVNHCELFVAVQLAQLNLEVLQRFKGTNNQVSSRPLPRYLPIRLSTPASRCLPLHLTVSCAAISISLRSVRYI